MIDVRVCSVRQATPSTRTIRVDLEGVPFSYLPGHVAVVGVRGEAMRAPYSIASAPLDTERGGYLEFLTRLDPISRLRDVRRGARLEIEGPLGSFTLSRTSTEQNLLFVAGGTGIAPLRSMIRQGVLARERATRRLLYSARTPVDFAYLRELRQLARRGHLELALTATREVPPRWRGDRGRITPERLARLVNASSAPDMLCYVCGPAAMVDDVPRMLAELGVDRKRIRIEEW